MYILGLNIGHNATACLLKDGKIIGCVSEERFTRIKNHFGVPLRSIEYLFLENKVTIKDMGFVVLDDQYAPGGNSFYGRQFLEAYTKKSLKKRFLSGLGYSYPALFKKYFNFKEGLTAKKRKNEEINLRKSLSDILKFPEEKIIITGHHLLHALSTCFNIRDNRKWLVFTLDGEGSGLCATVNIFDGNKLETISTSKKSASLGYLYIIATIFLGMKPLEHEFKVMGLAPYAKSNKVEELYTRFKELIWIDENLEFKSKFDMAFSDNFFRKEMKFVRFDNIAAALQKLVEDLTSEWVRSAIRKTGIKNVSLSGGVFMNVKANQRISELPEVERIFVMPSCGDEANAIGACFYGYKKYCEENNIKFSTAPIQDLYLGPEYKNEYIASLIKRESLDKRFIIKRVKNINLETAKLLVRGEIVGRCSGKSEWGARALGNRSILANPSDTETIRILNETIKDRDFWMPFTPSILDSFEKMYIENQKHIFSPYMVMTFDSTQLARKDMPAAMHPYDFTIRPQIVTKEYNKDYHEIISNFKKLTGIGALLNTSFNLHGEPNVLTPEDALRTVENSDLKFLVMGDYVFEKKSLHSNLSQK